MFIGHFAVGLAAKRVAPSLNLGLAFMACQLPDLVWPVLVMAGWEHVAVDHAATVVTPLDFASYPYSHSLVMGIVYALVVGGVTGRALRSAKAGAVMGALVVSHWVLDFVTHRPDMPILLGDPRFGLGLWNNLIATLLVEAGMFAAGLWLYLGARGPATRGQTIGFWSLIAALDVIYLANLFGPKPPLDAPAMMIAGPALAMWLFVVWAYFADRDVSATP